MANHETNWILNLVDKITEPLRSVNDSTKKTASAVDNVTNALGDMDKETREVAQRSLKSHHDLTAEIQKEEAEIQKLTRRIDEAGKAMDPLSRKQIDFKIGQAETKVRRYKEQLSEVDRELEAIEDGPDPQKLEANWGAAVVVANQTAELVQKAVDTFNFSVGIEDLRVNIQRMTGETGDSLDDLTGRIHAMGRVAKEAPEEIARAANAMTKQVGGTYEENLALIEAGFQKGANINGDFLDQLKEYPTFIKQMGLTQSEAIAFMAQAGKDGIFSDKAIDSIKEANNSLNEMGQPQIDALRGIGLAAEDLAGKTGFEAVRMISGAMEGATAQAKQLVLADIFKGAGEDAGLGFIEGLDSIDLNINNIPAVKASGASTRGWLAELEAEFSDTFGGIVTAASELSGVAIFVSSMIPIISSLTKVTWIQTAATKVATGVQWLWNAALTANPIGLVVAGVAALVGGIIWAYTEFEGFRKVIHGTWEVIKLFGNTIKEFVLDRIQGLLSGITGLGKALMQFFTGDWKAAWETGKNAVGDLVGIEAGGEAYRKLSSGIAGAYADGAQKGAESFAAGQEKNKSSNDYNVDLLGGPVLGPKLKPDSNDFNFGLLKMDGTGEEMDGTGTITGGKGGKQTTGGAKVINMTLNVNNNLDVKDGADFWNRKEELLDYIVGRINDTFKDAVIATGA